MPIEIVNGTPNRVPYDTGEGSQINGARSEPSVEQKQSGRSATHDTVSLTDTATNLQKINREINELPVVDTQRVEAIRQAIASGSYEVDPQRTAEKMIALESALSRSGE
ncbi:MAG: hypothetical protein Kow006_24470 [Gammaproteobacteria bacterium]